MRNEPPEITGENEPDHNQSFASNAALAALVAPLIVIGLAMASKGAVQTAGPGNRGAVLTMAGVSLVFLLVGPLLGIIALAIGRPLQHRTVLWRSVSGILLSGLLLAIAIPNFVHARTKAARNKAAVNDVTSA
ncbi:MAG TPA: hypothetical protein VMZ27_16185, partial [Candidatus Saccharimonadales bacterium]|nr:hypothetical protein [Candidatus Saccharimonadales bacterium]